MKNEKLKIKNEKSKNKPVLCSPSSLFFLCSLYFFLCSFAFAQTPDPREAARFDTVRFGTETEIAGHIQSLRSENADYLDDEIIALVENTRNQRILSGSFSFFADREKAGLENRAIRAIDERDLEETETVLSAIDYLGRMKEGRAAPYLQELLDNEERRFLGAAFRALGRVSGSGSEASDKAAEYLIDYYSNRSPATDNHRDMIVAIGATRSPRGVAFLSDIAVDTDERGPLRMAALEALASIGHADGLDAVLTCVSARDPNVRSAAVAALGPFSGDAVDKAILDAFRDSFFRSRLAAAQASRQRKLVAAVPYLRFRAENDEATTVREESVRALGAIANTEALQVLENLFTVRRNPINVRVIAAEMLMQSEPEKHLERFIEELDEAKQRGQTAMYNGLIRILSTAKCAGMEPLARRLILDRGIVEKSTALDLAANNNLTGLADEIKVLAEDRNESLARKARRTLESLGIQYN